MYEFYLRNYKYCQKIFPGECDIYSVQIVQVYSMQKAGIREQ